VVIAYLLGSFPAAYIVAKKRKGIDIREVGVRNMGGGNVMREVGRPEGILVILCDIGKGALAVYIAQLMGVAQLWVLAAGFAAMLGHNYPVYIGFRGGKGVATIMGIFFVLSPAAMLGTTAVIGIALLFVRHLFVGVAIASPFFLFLIWYSEGIGPMFYLTIVVVIFQFIRSIGRLGEVKTVTSVRMEKYRNRRRA